MNAAAAIETERLSLIEITPAFLRADRLGPVQLAEATECFVPPEWPPEHWEAAGVTYLLEYMAQCADYPGWVRFITLRVPPGAVERPALVGMCGTTMPILPDTTTVEIGYSLLEPYQGRGYATEAVTALLRWTFGHPQVVTVQAQTFPTLLKSIRVLEKTGFVLVGVGPEPGAILYGRQRLAP